MIARAVSHGHYGRVNQAQILATKIKASVDLRAARKLVSLLPQKPVVAKMFPMSSKKRHWICAITAHVIQLCWQWIDVIVNNCRQTTVQSPVFGFVFFASFTINVVDGVSNDIKNKWSAAAATTTATTKTQRFWVLFFFFFLHKHVLFISMSTLLSWAYLEVTTSSRYNDSLQAYAAGAVEAAVTSQVSIIPLRNLWFRVNYV